MLQLMFAKQKPKEAVENKTWENCSFFETRSKILYLLVSPFLSHTRRTHGQKLCETRLWPMQRVKDWRDSALHRAQDIVDSYIMKSSVEPYTSPDLTSQHVCTLAPSVLVISRLQCNKSAGFSEIFEVSWARWASKRDRSIRFAQGRVQSTPSFLNTHPTSQSRLYDKISMDITRSSRKHVTFLRHFRQGDYSVELISNLFTYSNNNHVQAVPGILEVR